MHVLREGLLRMGRGETGQSWRGFEERGELSEVLSERT